MKKRIKERLSIILLSVAFICTIGLIISNQREEQEEIVLGAVAEKRYVADYAIENTVASDLLRDKAAEQVKDVYEPDSSVNTRILTGIDNLFEELGAMRQSYIPIEAPGNPITPEGATDVGEGATELPVNEVKSFTYDLDSDVKISDTQLEYIATMASADFVALRNTVKSVIETELEAGINDDSTSLQRIILTIREELEAEDITEKDIKIGFEIIAYYLEPNAFLNRAATDIKKEEARAAVEPIMLMKGEKIVGEAEKINAEAYAILNILGYTDSSADKNIISMVGRIIFVFMVFVVIALYLQKFAQEQMLVDKNKYILFMFYMAAIFIARLLVLGDYMFIPIVAFTMLVAILIKEELSIIFGLCVTLMVGQILEAELSFYLYFLITAPMGSMIGKRILDRDEVFVVSAIISVVSVGTFYSIDIMMKRSFWSSTMSQSLLIAFLMGIVTVVFVMGSTPYWESLFGIMSQNKLMDLSNPKNPLIRRMIIEAPGTYHHSLIVANLAETAAFDIGANSNLARVGGYYHDIGKMRYPGYFTENQMGENPHDYLDPKASAKIIISHLENGEKLGKEYKLPKEIIDMVIQHHGNTVVKYFYHKARELNGPDNPPDINDFRYPYDPPTFRESGVLMLADTVEAAVRSMIPQGKTIDEVSDVVKALIKDKLDHGQLINSGLTIKDLDTIHNSFMRVFKGMYQQRIPYPKGTTQAIDELEERKQLEEAAKKGGKMGVVERVEGHEAKQPPPPIQVEKLETEKPATGSDSVEEKTEKMLHPHKSAKMPEAIDESLEVTEGLFDREAN